MSRFIVTLTDEERAKLEEHRIALGKRSHADVFRHWIAQLPEGHYTQAQAGGPISRGKLDTVTERVSFGPRDAITGKPLERRGPLPKGSSKR